MTCAPATGQVTTAPWVHQTRAEQLQCNYYCHRAPLLEPGDDVQGPVPGTVTGASYEFSPTALGLRNMVHPTAQHQLTKTHGHGQLQLFGGHSVAFGHIANGLTATSAVRRECTAPGTRKFLADYGIAIAADARAEHRESRRPKGVAHDADWEIWIHVWVQKQAGLAVEQAVAFPRCASTARPGPCPCPPAACSSALLPCGPPRAGTSAQPPCRVLHRASQSVAIAEFWHLRALEDELSGTPFGILQPWPLEAIPGERVQREAKHSPLTATACFPPEREP